MMTYARPIVDDESLERALPTLSNWGRWGPDDQLGTLNLITTDKRLAAAALIRSGRVVPLGREFAVDTPELRNFAYTMRRYDDPLPEESGSFDIVAMTCHGFAVTHLDALCHIFTPQGSQGMYNGYPISNVTDTGTQKLGIEHVGATGIVGRGVLLDVAEVHGGPLPLGTAITPADWKPPNRPTTSPSARATSCSSVTAPEPAIPTDTPVGCTPHVYPGYTNAELQC